ncbi:MAG: universal stress protein [Candidatus Rokubacteria bacterium]|nr:universal stress protein [Candidatus Rokubacteria bacterium]
MKVLIATDGSPAARAAVLTARHLPWPDGTQVRGIVAVDGFDATPRLRRALSGTYDAIAAQARRSLAARWPDVEVVTQTGAAANTILREARRYGADVIVIGWRGHGALRRLLMGSVSREVVEGARRAVLVVQRPMRRARRLVVGVDGSPNARRAVDLAGRLAGGTINVRVVRVVEPRTVPTAGRLPASIRTAVLRELATLNQETVRRARRDVDGIARRLARSGTAARGEVRTGTPLVGLLDAVDGAKAHLLVVGARATSGVKRALLGSVAVGALNRCRVPVLVVH